MYFSIRQNYKQESVTQHVFSELLIYNFKQTD